MNGRPIRLALPALLAFAAGLGGVYAGHRLQAPETGATQLQALIDHGLALDPAQREQVRRIRARFEGRHMALHAEMRRDNALLARAMADEHAYGPGITVAVARLHRAMGAMQEVVLREMLAIRAVLRPDQAAQFDAAVARALRQDR